MLVIRGSEQVASRLYRAIKSGDSADIRRSVLFLRKELRCQVRPPGKRKGLFDAMSPQTLDRHPVVGGRVEVRASTLDTVLELLGELLSES